jgi:RNA polymerase sigma-70 factor (ECF subfamily)
VVLAAGDTSASQHERALSSLCEAYWFPLYAYLRRSGYNSHQAEDYTQGFLTYLLEKHALRRADPACGRFRSFLLGTLKNFLAGERDRAKTQKRGGSCKILSLDFADAETRYAIQPVDNLSPERFFDRYWALTVLNRTIGRLKEESENEGKQKQFSVLKIYIASEGDFVPYKNVAAKLKMTEGAVKVAVHRLRKRYRGLLRDEIAQTVDTEDQIDDEIQTLFSAFAH